ncbi:MAG: cytidine deaminase [Prevotellaceae bacterium]|jgi:cytidine deaminase|nr:cytidine deaminase [Prevotellaceae bacterium]
MNEKKIEITVYEAAGIHELTSEDAALLEKAMDATRRSYAPYSHFHVGAAALLDNGETVCGSNQENAAYPSGLCAERVALFYATSQFPQAAIRAIAISSSVNGKANPEPVYPCGSCRQVLLECESRSGKPVKVIMGGTQKIHIVHSVGDLLPLGFELSMNNEQ